MTEPPQRSELVVQRDPQQPKDDFGCELFTLFWIDTSPMRSGGLMLRGQVFYTQLEKVLQRSRFCRVRYIPHRPAWALPEESK